MSIADFERLIKKIKLEVQEGNVNKVLEDIITVASVSRKTTNSEFDLIQHFIRKEKLT